MQEHHSDYGSAVCRRNMYYKQPAVFSNDSSHATHSSLHMCDVHLCGLNLEGAAGERCKAGLKCIPAAPAQVHGFQKLNVMGAFKGCSSVFLFQRLT